MIEDRLYRELYTEFRIGWNFHIYGHKVYSMPKHCLEYTVLGEPLPLEYTEEYMKEVINIRSEKIN